MYDNDPLLQAATLYAATFAGRTDAYARWAGDETNGHWQLAQRPILLDGVVQRDEETGYPLLERIPLSPEIVLTAFKTGIGISGYLLAANSTSHLAALDIDREDGLGLARRVGAYIHQLGGLGYLEPSRRGAHFWLILDAVRSGTGIRRALRQLIIEAGLPECPNDGSCPKCRDREQPDGTFVVNRQPGPHPDPRIELRPGSDRLNDEGGVGHAIRMATMPHPKTHKRYGLISTEGEKLPAKLVEMMLEVRSCPAGILDDLAERGPAPKMGPPPLDLGHAYGLPVVNESASEILQQLWGAQNAQPGKLIRCPAHEDRHPSLSILKDDQRAICHTPGCTLNNNDRGRGTHELRALAPHGVHA